MIIMSERSPWCRFIGIFALSLAALQSSATTFNPNSLPALIAAINAAADGDVIDLGGGTFSLDLLNYANDLTDGINGLPNISVDLTIQNGVIERDSSLSNVATDNEHFRLLHIASGASLSLKNVALANGLAAEGIGNGLFGGALYNLGILNLDRVFFIENIAVNLGGAIYNAASIPTINDSIFIHNNFLSPFKIAFPKRHPDAPRQEIHKPCSMF